MTTERESNKSKVLDIGTQTILMKDAPSARCRCGSLLNWKYSTLDPSLSAVAECQCDMEYMAWLATVKIEGIDRSTL